MKCKGWLLLAMSLLTLTTGGVLLTRNCLGERCLTISTGFCQILFSDNPFYYPCIWSTDQWGNQDECVHPHYIPVLCDMVSRTPDTWLFQCYPPPPPGATGPHAQWMEIRVYRCGTKCRAEFVTKKPLPQPVEPPVEPVEVAP